MHTLNVIERQTHFDEAGQKSVITMIED